MKSTPHRALIFSDFDEVITDVDTLAERGYLRHGNWTLSQMCEHFEIVFRGAIDGFNMPLYPLPIRSAAGRIVLPFILWRKRMMVGVKAPPGLLPTAVPSPDGDTVDNPENIVRFKSEVNRFLSHAGEYAESPIFGKLSRDQWHRLQLIHCAHHLNFLSLL